MRRGDILRLKQQWADLPVGTTFVVEDARYKIDGVLKNVMYFAMRAFTQKDMRTVTSAKVRVTGGAANEEDVDTYITLQDMDDVTYFSDCCEVTGRDDTMNRTPIWVTLIISAILVTAIAYPVVMHLSGVTDAVTVTTRDGTRLSAHGKPPPRFGPVQSGPRLVRRTPVNTFRPFI